MRSRWSDGQACYAADITLGTFLDCWSPDCYTAAYQYWLIKFNDLEVGQEACANRATTVRVKR